MSCGEDGGLWEEGLWRARERERKRRVYSLKKGRVNLKKDRRDAVTTTRAVTSASLDSLLSCRMIFCPFVCLQASSNASATWILFFIP